MEPKYEKKANNFAQKYGIKLEVLSYEYTGKNWDMLRKV